MRLDDLITAHFRLTQTQKSALKRLRLETISELLYHFPVRYEEAGERTLLTTAAVGSDVTLYGRFIKLETKKSWKRKIPISEGVFEDGSGKIKTMWFHQPYIAKMIMLGVPVKVTGKITGTAEKKYIANPSVERLDALPENADSFLSVADAVESDIQVDRTLTPVYPETKGITSLWFYHALQRIFSSGLTEKIADPIPDDLLKRYHLPSLTTALLFIHVPQKKTDSEVARKRFAFEEVLCVQLLAAQRRKEREAAGAIPITIDQRDITTFTERFGFPLTDAQSRAIQTIVADMREARPMSRLLEGDVGSGKTAVAATISYAAIAARRKDALHEFTQVAYMAPTEVLARQLYLSFIEYFKHLPIRIGLLTGSAVEKFPSKSNPSTATHVSKNQMLSWIKSGDIQIVIGTHALIQKSVDFKNLILTIIDEQHRFGTRQRHALVKKHIAPHLLSMTATPIPRTLALTIYGDLDLTLLDSMPPGRKPIQTELVFPEKRNTVYTKITGELNAGRQAYVICPRIDAPDPSEEFALQAASVQETVEELRSGPFKDFRIAALHSKLSPKEKENIMAQFAAHTIDILVATSVVEVGVNVPNATIIMIEGAERFGLSQLHQLRGRVIRSNHQAYCFLISSAKSQGTKDRLKALTTAKNGFELAEKDLALRGSGELYGRRQWGISDLGMEAIKNIKMVEAARTEARRIIDEDPQLSQHSELHTRALQRDEVLHFE